MCDGITIGGDVSIQISGPCVPPDGSVTAAKINSGNAVDGQVLTADGNGGAAWQAVSAPAPEPALRASTTWAPGTIGDSGVAVTTITVNGAAQGDVAGASHSELGGDDFIISAYVQSANTVRVLILNKSGETLTVGSGTLQVMVWK